MDKQQPVCAICGTTVQLLRCAKCKTVYYCSTNHQHMDWARHKQQCRQLAKQKNNQKQMQQQQQLMQMQSLSQQQQQALHISASPSFDWAATAAQLQMPLAEDSTSNYAANNLLPYGTNGATASYMLSNNVACGNSAAPGILSAINAPASHLMLGTSETEILSTQAESVSTRNSNGLGYFGNTEANSTTMDQMHTYSDLSQVDQQQYHCARLLQTTVQQPAQLTQRVQQQTQLDQSNIVPTVGAMGVENVFNQPQELQQQQQQLGEEQNGKNASYQIGRLAVGSGGGDQAVESDENAIGNVNERRYEDLCRNIINDMNQYGLSVVDDFLGMEKGLQILNEVHHMYAAGVFKDGQLVSNLIAEQDLRTIRGDKITWVKGVEPGCSNVGYLINQIDAVICRANTMHNNGKLGNYNIRERTKAMVACYPGSGSHYVMHVDNPNRDGRVITAIYYLNVNWDTQRSGGMLRIFPEHGGSVADIEPKFDRLIFFWSDKRNPHEVQPAHRTRYAITVWYFDANEREAALNRCRQYKNNALRNGDANSTEKANNLNTNLRTNSTTTTSADFCT